MENHFAFVKTLLDRLREDGYATYDHYDFWSTRIGMALRRRNRGIFLPLTGAAYVGDVLFPRLFRLGLKPSVAMETLPLLLGAMRAYFRETGDPVFEKDRGTLRAHMLERLGRSRHGRGLGHQFDWHVGVLIPAYTPCVTFTSWLVDYMIENGDGAPDGGSLRVLEDVGEFVFRDLNAEELDGGMSRVSYTPLDRRRVINANSFAARIMRRLGRLFNNGEYLAFSRRLSKYVVAMQNGDGSFSYFEPGSVPDGENFIDCFHTAFVLENLIDESGEDEAARAAFEKGMRHFMATFVGDGGEVRHFAKSHIPLSILTDTRSSAEAVTLLARAGALNPSFLETAERVLGRITADMYDEKGRFYLHRRYSFRLSRMHYARWSTIPMINAITALAPARRGKPAP